MSIGLKPLHDILKRQITADSDFFFKVHANTISVYIHVQLCASTVSKGAGDFI